MNWDDLRVFLAVTRAPTMAAAAKALRIDASTVGRRMSRLAEALDATLFEGPPGAQVLSEPGRRLLAHAEAVEQAAAGAREDLAGERSLLSGNVRVSVTEGFGTWVLARHLAAFHEAHPGIAVELVATNGFLNPSKREADLAIMLARPQKGPLLARRLADYRLKLYAAPGYRQRRGTPAATADLKQHTLIGYISDFIYSDELRYLDEIEPGLAPSLASSSINVQHGLTRASAGIGVLPCFIGDEDAGLVRILDDEVSITRSFWLVVHKDTRPLARVAAFIDWLDGLVVHRRAQLIG